MSVKPGQAQFRHWASSPSRLRATFHKNRTDTEPAKRKLTHCFQPHEGRSMRTVPHFRFAYQPCFASASMRSISGSPDDDVGHAAAFVTGRS